ncbi:homeobox protein VENTX [Choloepus didactylus]|uniref:homeobox protein VENTX n=1 Tax=Choloepus didactylus TaxID=27675 RepID=UPI00189CB859|nr:homeobox protein VENTX [Choloepus didactylus]
MPPSSHLPGSRKPCSSFCSVAWLSQTSCRGPTHTSRPAEVSWGGLAAPTLGSHSGEPLQTVSSHAAKTPDLSVQGTPVTARAVTAQRVIRGGRDRVYESLVRGLCKEPGPGRAPRVRTAFTAAQVSTLESSFQHRRYLGPPERKKLAKELQLSEVQIKTWFQNRRMKHKRQMQDSQLNVPFSGPLYTPLALCPPPSALGSGLQLLYPGAPLPGPQTLVLPAGSFWGSCHVEQASLAPGWASCSWHPLAPCLPDPGSQVHTLRPSLSGGPWNLGALSEPKDAF